jgi:heat shock protein HtpX
MNQMMKRNACGRDFALSARMAVTMTLLGLLYLAVLAAPLWLLSVGLLSVLYAFGLDGLLLLLLGLQYLSLDRIALAASRAQIVDCDGAPELHAAVDRLCAVADLPKPRLAIVSSDVPNAFATGRNPAQSTVVVTRGLVKELEAPEVQAVLAHELSHVANRDGAVMTFASFPALTLREGLGSARLRVWIFGFPFMLLGCLLYLISTGLMLTISRSREYAADRGSVLITGTPEHLMSALQKIAGSLGRIPERDLREVHSMSAFFIIPTKLRGYSHPPLAKRLARLAEMARELGQPEPAVASVAGVPARTTDALIGLGTFVVVFGLVMLVAMRFLI